MVVHAPEVLVHHHLVWEEQEVLEAVANPHLQLVVRAAGRLHRVGHAARVAAVNRPEVRHADAVQVVPPDLAQPAQRGQAQAPARAPRRHSRRHGLYYTRVDYTILYYTILYYTMLYYAILYYAILYYTILCYTILYYTILYYTILHYTTL